MTEAEREEITRRYNISFVCETGNKFDQIIRIKTTDHIDAFTKVDFVIEAVSENTDLKQKIFRDLARVTPTHSILATNTSSISITKIAAVTGRAEKVIGMHFVSERDRRDKES
jgi:3-hydroxybutyryl-CoA dehydrogenase